MSPVARHTQTHTHTPYTTTACRKEVVAAKPEDVGRKKKGSENEESTPLPPGTEAISCLRWRGSLSAMAAWSCECVCVCWYRRVQLVLILFTNYSKLLIEFQFSGASTLFTRGWDVGVVFFLWYMFLTPAPFFVPPDGKCSFVLTLVTLSRHHSRHQPPVTWVTSVQPNSSINASSPRQKKMGNRGGLGIFANVLGRSGPERVLPTPNTITVSYQCQ